MEFLESSGICCLEEKRISFYLDISGRIFFETWIITPSCTSIFREIYLFCWIIELDVFYSVISIFKYFYSVKARTLISINSGKMSTPNREKLEFFLSEQWSFCTTLETPIKWNRCTNSSFIHSTIADFSRDKGIRILDGVSTRTGRFSSCFVWNTTYLIRSSKYNRLSSSLFTRTVFFLIREEKFA